jgi:DNA-directed RNA polymerase subunit K/omega
LKNYGDIDSKFRYVILASLRAKQLLKGAKPRIKSKSKNLIRIAQEEVKQGQVDYALIQPKEEEMPESKDKEFIGKDIVEEIETESVKESRESQKSKEKTKAKKKGKG